MMNTMYGNPGMIYGNNYANGMPIAKPRMSNPITAEEKDALKTQTIDQFNLSLDVVDMAKAFCTHKDPNTQLFTTVENPDGTVTCTVCHETFDPDLCTDKAVEDAAKTMKNVLQTLKLLALDLPDDVIRGYFGFLPYIDKIPQLYKIAKESFNRYNNPSLYGNTQQANNGMNAFAAFNNIMNPAMPVYNNYMMQQPQQYYNPQQAAMMGQPGQMPGNPFYSQYAQQPMMQQYYNPQQAAMMGQPQGQPMMQQPMAPAPSVQTAPVAPQAPGQPEQVVIKEQLTL